MVVARVFVFLAGAALVYWALLAAIRTVVVPRGVTSNLTRWVFQFWRWVFSFLARPQFTFERRDRVMALFAPVALVSLPLVWVIVVTIGYMGLFWGVGAGDLAEVYHLSGSSLLTLGFAPADGVVEQTLAFSEATIGLGIVALLITFLPSIYSTFSARERMVTKLEVRAGSPPSAPVFIIRLHQIGGLTKVANMWLDWEDWFAMIEESHTSYPSVSFLRSPRPERHWVTTAGTILDSAALYQSALDVPQMPTAGLCIRAGYIALRAVADFFGVAYDVHPEPTDPISITKAEFNAVLDHMAAEGVPLKQDREQAWIDFAGWRVNYDTVLLALAEITMAPYAPWTSDRSAVNHREPEITSWGGGSGDVEADEGVGTP